MTFGRRPLARGPTQNDNRTGRLGSTSRLASRFRPKGEIIIGRSSRAIPVVDAWTLELLCCCATLSISASAWVLLGRFRVARTGSSRSAFPRLSSFRFSWRQTLRQVLAAESVGAFCSHRTILVTRGLILGSLKPLLLILSGNTSRRRFRPLVPELPWSFTLVPFLDHERSSCLRGQIASRLSTWAPKPSATCQTAGANKDDGSESNGVGTSQLRSMPRAGVRQC
jgi:hypothetical protein